MKKHNITQFLKSKSFYVVLFVAVIAIAAVTVVGLNLRSGKSKDENLVDLNTPVEISENEKTDTQDMLGTVNKNDAVSNDSDHSKDEVVVGDYTNEDLLEFDVGSYTTDDNTAENKDAKKASESTKTEDTQQAKAENEEEAVPVSQPKVTLDSLQFSEESNLVWPVKGNVIMPFSVENLIHYATLGEWKTNPAIVISAETGADVVCSATGIVSSVTNNEETGTTVTMNIGNGYEIVYGQLAEVTCDKGDIVNMGTVIGKVAAPTKYYVVEGSNLYLQVVNNGTPVNPMLYLASEE